MRRARLLVILCIFLCSCAPLQPREEQVVVLDRYWVYTVAYKYKTTGYGYCYGWHDGEWTYDWGWCEEERTRCERTTTDRELPVYSTEMCPMGYDDWSEETLNFYILAQRLEDGTKFRATIEELEWKHFEVGVERQVLVSITGHVVAWTDDFEREKE